MASTPRPANVSLEEELTQRGHRFSFFQAMRLLSILAESGGEGRKPCRVRIVPELSLAFPPADVACIEKTRDGYRLKVTFLGLYGQSSPLPTFYTEQLMDDVSVDMTAARDLIDIVNHHLYTLFHECTTKNRLYFQVAQQAQEEYLELLFCLIGLGGRKFRRHLPDPEELLRYPGLLTQHPRSALGLERFLSDALQVPVKVDQCQRRRVSIPKDQRLRLGVCNATLGEDAVLGREVIDRSSKFRIVVGPLDRETFAAYLPGTPGRDRLGSLLHTYLTLPLTWEIELIYSLGEAPSFILGTETGGRLGWDSWLAPAYQSSGTVVFPGDTVPVDTVLASSDM